MAKIHKRYLQIDVVWAALALAMSLVLTGGVAQAQSSTLAVTLDGQQTDMWCWAATTQMTVGFHGTSITQCEEANAQFGRTDCCSNKQACAQGGWPEYSKWGYQSKNTSWGTPLSWDQLKAQIDAKLPTNFSWGWTCSSGNCGGHIMVARGYSTTGGVNYVYINDPWPPNQGETKWITYSEYVSSSGHVHWRDYYDVKQ